MVHSSIFSVQNHFWFIESHGVILNVHQKENHYFVCRVGYFVFYKSLLFTSLYIILKLKTRALTLFCRYSKIHVACISIFSSLCLYVCMHVKSVQCRVAVCVQYLSFVRISDLKTTLETNAQTQISGVALLEIIQIFSYKSFQSKHYHRLSPAYFSKENFVYFDAAHSEFSSIDMKTHD